MRISFMVSENPINPSSEVINILLLYFLNHFKLQAKT